MKRTVSIGNQNFADIITNNYFYLDKTRFIREWWESGDTVTLITRPRRFGKTLNMNMTECFFSARYAGRTELFEGLSIWKEEKYRQLQGTYPVISLSFADIKDVNYQGARERICRLIVSEYARHTYLLEGDCLTSQEKETFCRKSVHMSDVEATLALRELAEYLSRYFGEKVIILLDEYDTPMQEAYVNGYWKELSGFIRSLFNSTFKTNPYLGRALMTGIAHPASSGVTRVSRESIFSDLNNLAGQLIREGSRNVKLIMEDLLCGRSFHARIDEQIVYDQLDDNEEAIWSLLLAAGYLKVVHYEEKMTPFGEWVQDYELALTNFEVKVMFQGMIRGWFGASRADYNDFVNALLQGNTEEMNAYMNRVCETVFCSFDTAKGSGGRMEPEKFYHGFVLGLMIELNERYVITSNRESGLGRYDVALEPRNRADDAVLIEFKVRNPKKERTLEDTLQNALEQIEARGYAAGLRQRGIEEAWIRRYGFAFEGKNVLIGGA